MVHELVSSPSSPENPLNLDVGSLLTRAMEILQGNTECSESKV